MTLYAVARSTNNVSGLAADSGISEWVPSPNAEIDCEQHHLCTSQNMTYHHRGSNHYHSGVLACEMLSRMQVSNIYFFGDSYLRHVAAGFHATLNDKHSLYTQEALKRSEEHHLNHLCNGTVLSHVFTRSFPDVKLLSKKNNSVVLLSFGNHNTGPGRSGVNNATLQLQKFRYGCKIFEEDGALSNKTKSSSGISVIGNININDNDNNHTNNKPRHFMYWVSTHAREKAYFPDESPHHVERFNDEMRVLIEAGGCTADTLFIDVFNMTKSLLRLDKREVQKLSADGVHWGRNVNMVKTQIILSEMERDTRIAS